MKLCEKEGVNEMSKVVITVKDGRVQEVFCRNKDIEVEVIDFDTQNLDESNKTERRYAQILKSKTYKNIL